MAAALLVLLTAIATPASADVGAKIIERCALGESLSGFSQRAYREALKELTTESEEYSECGELIRKAQLAAAAAGHGSTPASGNSGPAVTPVTPTERRALERTGHTGLPAVHVGNQIIQPGVVHADIASAVSSLPAPLLAVLAFLLACAVLLAGGTLARRIRARRFN